MNPYVFLAFSGLNQPFLNCVSCDKATVSSGRASGAAQAGSSPLASANFTSGTWKHRRWKNLAVLTGQIPSGNGILMGFYGDQ